MTPHQNPSDYHLVEQLRKEDMVVFDQISKRFGDRLFGFALGYLKSKEETEGLIQDVFLKIWENRKDLKKESSLKSYLFTIAYHDLCYLFRKKKIHKKFLAQKDSSETLSNNLEEELQYKSTLGRVNQLIDRLPEKQKAIFIKSRHQGKSSREIAEEMGLAPGTVDNQISAALKFLRKNLSADNFATLLFFAVFMQ